MRGIAIVCSAIIGAALLSFPALAQQKTVRACQDEWRANRAENQAKGITEKAYIAQCRLGGAMTPPTATAPVPPSARKATTGAAPAPQEAAPTRPAPSATVTPMGANQYTTEAQAMRRCGTGTVVWANLKSKIYHFAANKDYGHTKTGAYMCEQDATSQGMRAAKNEKHP